MSKNNGGQAFPAHFQAQMGMTLRDYFAATALSGLLAHHGFYQEGSDASSQEFREMREAALAFDQAAEYAYGQADAMLAERAK